MLFKIETLALQDVVSYTMAGRINPDPIGQRPPVQSGPYKSQGIIDSVLKGFSVGAITVRDISEDAENQAVYPGVRWLVVDGGNRIRAIRDFQAGRFATFDGKTYLTLTDEEREQFEKTSLLFYVYTCTNVEAMEIFRRLNTVTPVNHIEMIMSNDVSQIAKAIRSRVKSYKEYGYNDILPIFETKTKKDGSIVPMRWDTKYVNKRRRWDEYVGVAYVKAIGRGNVDAGLKMLEKVVDEDLPVSADVHKAVDTMFGDVLKVSMIKKKQLNEAVFSAFQAVWFGLYERNKTFVIKDHAAFADQFYTAHANLHGNLPHIYDKEVLDFSTGARGSLKKKTEIVRKFVRSAIVNYANPSEQHEVAQMYLGEMNLDGIVLFRDERRTVSKDTKFEMLAKQGFCCAIDGEKLDIDEAIFGHDTAWAHGGQIEDGAIIRKIHNVNMGTTTLDEYRMILELRKAKGKKNAELV